MKMKTLPILLLAAGHLLPILSLIYSLAVHIFLSCFHERSLLKIYHWGPIISRALFYCITTVIFNKSYSATFEASPPSSNQINNATIILSTTSAIIISISIKLIIQTRQIEINGPPPPHYNEVSKLHKTLQGKVIFITGANSGIGLETTRLLYHQYNATVILACRSRTRAIEAMRNIDPTWIKRSYNSSSGGIFGYRMHFIPMDLTSIKSIHDGVNIFLEMELPLHVLINNAGVMLNDRLETVDGLEMTMAANVSMKRFFALKGHHFPLLLLLFRLSSHILFGVLPMQHLGHFLLTNLLLPKLRQTAIKDEHPTKVITVSSSLYKNAFRRSNSNNNNETIKNGPGLDLIDLQCCNKPYRLFDQYAQSKLANILFARKLGERERPRRLVQSYALHPGLVRTNFTKNMPWYLYYPNIVFSFFLIMLQKSPECGAYTTVYCAVTDEENDDLCYFVNSKKQPLDKLALDDNDARELWKLSCQLVSLPLEKDS